MVGTVVVFVATVAVFFGVEGLLGLFCCFLNLLLLPPSLLAALPFFWLLCWPFPQTPLWLLCRVSCEFQLMVLSCQSLGCALTLAGAFWVSCSVCLEVLMASQRLSATCFLPQGLRCRPPLPSIRFRFLNVALWSTNITLSESSDLRWQFIASALLFRSGLSSLWMMPESRIFAPVCHTVLLRSHPAVTRRTGNDFSLKDGLRYVFRPIVLLLALFDN